ncbi:Succinate dehydrogenase/fumarate reductase, flavoprotein subunit [Azotobacter beijerinckii]|uniref:L-aspartate oxidase n=1 Tax=Azotobacter beijerinckii TaxID=170623 RepID=A0A1H6Z9D9_9GAMM|nr:FAD-binding protein [Azotobacter beijerinckii]SEJ49346.1 Succinate dehydrogenase/fumarate reductase, flavoprotein subunit [Azotobacter beijerinckii]
MCAALSFYSATGASQSLELQADVLVLGGGLSGTWAAITAARAGARVILADKGWCGTSGVTATAGPGHWWVPPEERRAAIDKRLASAQGLADPHWMARILDCTWRTLPTLAGYYEFPRNEQSVPQYRGLRGPEYMRGMRRLAEDSGVRILDQSPAMELLRNADGRLAGARGWQRQARRDWQVRAPAVVVATGGCGFLSRLLGSQTNTGDGHLMAVEAGAELSGMEFSSYYCIAPLDSTMTRSMVYTFGSYFDDVGRRLEIVPGPNFTNALARALLQGPVYCRLERVPEALRAHLPYVQPNLLLPFARRGIDPYRDKFPVTLHAEGTIRGVGGLRVVDANCQTGVPGLFAAGDAASRELVTGAISGGGAVNAAWALSSGQWAGQGAARYARGISSARNRGLLLGLGGIGMPRQQGERTPDTRSLVRRIQEEMHPYDKNLFRTASQLTRSLTVLENVWDHLRHAPQGHGGDPLRVRETAALAALARWCYGAAQERRETRGLHQRTDAPTQRAEFDLYLRSGGLDRPWVRRDGLPAIAWPGFENRSHHA